MSEKTTSDETNDGAYPKKYWWVILVAVPVAVALIQIVPNLLKNNSGGGGSSTILNDLSTKTFVTNITIVEREYEALKRGPLPDDQRKQIETALALLADEKAAASAAAFEKINQKISLPALQTNLGVAYQKAGRSDAATQTFSTVLAQDPNYGAAHLNLGVVQALSGKLIEAQQHFEKADGLGESKALVRAIQHELKVHDRELEPNNELTNANVLPLGKSVAGDIFEKNDVDVFQITAPPKYRDILQVQLANKSPTLRANVSIRDQKGSHLSDESENTPAASLEHMFSVPPDAKFLVTVYGYNSTGPYALTVNALKRYDAFEPNETFNAPALVEVGQEISASIMDKPDADWYKFKTAPKGATVKVRLENKSDTLRPSLEVRDSEKRYLHNKSEDSPGANLNYSFPVQPDSLYLIGISGYNSFGIYTLLLTQE